MPIWLALQGPNMDLKSTLDTKFLADIRAKRADIAILPVLQNVTDGKWDGAGLARLLQDKTRSAALVQQVTDMVGANKLQGVVVDFEEIPADGHAAVQDFLKHLSAAFLPPWLDRRDGGAVRRQ